MVNEEAEVGYIPYYNGSGQTIPSYGVIMFASDASATPGSFLFLKRLFGSSYSVASSGGTIVAFNSKSPCASGKYGKCHFAIGTPAWAAIDGTSAGSSGLDLSNYADSWVGREFGPQASSFVLVAGGQGYYLCSAPDMTNGRVLVIKKPGSGGGDVYRGKADAAITKGGHGTVSRYDTSDDSDTGINDTVYAVLANVSTGKWMYYTMVGERYEFLSGEC